MQGQKIRELSSIVGAAVVYALASQAIDVQTPEQRILMGSLSVMLIVLSTRRK